MLCFENVTFSYGKKDVPVLNNISFSVEKGSFVSIIGASGSGKSTIFRLINSLDAPDHGRIIYEGSVIDGNSHIAGYMPQQDLLFPWRNVLKNVMLPMEIQKIPDEKKQEKALKMLERVGLSGWEKRYPRELSGGMRQRVSFARTLCTGKELLLLDEPFSALDAITRIDLREWLHAQWNSLGNTIIFITHDVEEALFLSQKTIVLTGRPVNNVREFIIPLPKIRDRSMLSDPRIEEMKELLTDILRKEASDEN